MLQRTTCSRSLKIGRDDISKNSILRKPIRFEILLLYGLEVFLLYNYQLKSLDFVTNRFLMKLFSTSNIHVISDYQEQFNFVLPSVQLVSHAKKFANKLHVN